MKRNQVLVKSLFACGLALAFAVTNVFAAPAQTSQTALVTGLTGVAKYTVNGDTWLPLATGIRVPAGATIQTATNAMAYLLLNEPSTRIIVSTNTVVKLEKIAVLAGDAGDTDTQLNLRLGEVACDVKKLSKASHFDVKTPSGVAGIRGTQFAIKVLRLADGNYQVIFTSVSGQLVAAAMVAKSDDPQTKVLNTMESWTPGGDVVPASPSLVALYRVWLSSFPSPGGLVPPPITNPAFVYPHPPGSAPSSPSSPF